MAAAFLATHGIDLQAEIDRATMASLPHSALSNSASLSLSPPHPITSVRSVLLPSHPSSPQDILVFPSCTEIISLDPSADTFFHSSTILAASSCLCLPALTHPHIHLDKAHLYSHPTYDDLRPESGTFEEALALTGKAKKLFGDEDLLQRANWLVAESVAAGVTAMRAFVEVDAVVGMIALEMGVKIRETWKERCHIQLCAFAQEAVMVAKTSPPSAGDDEAVPEHWNARGKTLVEEAAAHPEIEVVGSAPYVEQSDFEASQNIQWTIELAIKHRKHLDFHLDYNLDPSKLPLILFVIAELHRQKWLETNPNRTICLGHCTRLTLLSNEEWKALKQAIADLPIYFVGLPTSDLFMMGRPASAETACSPRPRGTLPVVWMVKELGLKAVLGVNNVGNAFTPWGSADPLSVANLGVGLYQAGTGRDAEILYVSFKSLYGCRTARGGGNPKKRANLC
jgi:cytosine/adenosine deaminase-related metal-dependent hydrolase